VIRRRRREGGGGETPKDVMGFLHFLHYRCMCIESWADNQCQYSVCPPSSWLCNWWILKCQRRKLN